MALHLGDRTIALTDEGFLLDPEQWDADVAHALAHAHGIELTEAHDEIITILRDYCSAGNEPPSMRQLVAEIRRRLHDDPDLSRKAGSLHLMTLFGSSPAKMAARLAGLPKPKNCL